MMDSFTRSYLEAALWSSMDDADKRGGEPLDANYSPSDIAPDTLARIEADCRAFQRDNAADIGTEFERAAHDFWLTRNRHGAGFWDGDWPTDAGERLTAASHAAGEFELYVGDDGLLHG
jgi:hypothetical protein